MRADPIPFTIRDEPYRNPGTERPAWLADIARLRAGDFLNESRLQHYVESALLYHDTGATDLHYNRELALPGQAGRIDFAVEEYGIRWGVECKVNGVGLDVWRQLKRYAPYFDALVLVTTKAVSEYVELRRPDEPCLQLMADADSQAPLKWQQGEVIPVVVLDLWKNL